MEEEQLQSHRASLITKKTQEAISRVREFCCRFKDSHGASASVTAAESIFIAYTQLLP